MCWGLAPSTLCAKTDCYQGCRLSSVDSLLSIQYIQNHNSDKPKTSSSLTFLYWRFDTLFIIVRTVFVENVRNTFERISYMNSAERPLVFSLLQISQHVFTSSTQVDSNVCFPWAPLSGHRCGGKSSSGHLFGCFILFISLCCRDSRIMVHSLNCQLALGDVTWTKKTSTTKKSHI